MTQIKTPAEMLSEIGETLHGRDWQAPLARDLDMDRKNLQRWMSGHTELRPEHGAFDDALELLRKRADEIGAMADALDRWIKVERKSHTPPGAT
jgi:hypothetical protein